LDDWGSILNARTENIQTFAAVCVDNSIVAVPGTLPNKSLVFAAMARILLEVD
jgi:hypothetical protein